MSTVINCVTYEAGRRRAELDLKEACPAEADGNFTWVGLHEPNKELLRTVQQRFALHDLAIEDALLAHQRPKLEIYGDAIFVALRTAQLVEHKVQFGETHIFAGRGYVVTVRHGSTTAYREVRTRCESAPKMLAMGESFVVYSIIDFIVDNYFPVLHGLEAEADALEEEVFSSKSDKADVERIYELRHELLLLRRAVQPLQEVCNRIMRYDVPLIDHAMNDYFRDIQDHVIRVVEGIDNLRDLLDRGAGSEPAARVAGAEPSDQETDRLGRHPVDPARDRVDLRHEFQEHARTRASSRLSGRDGGDHRSVRISVLSLQARRLARERAIDALRRQHVDLGRFEPERFAERVPARLAGPVIAHVVRADVLGEQRREQHVAALRAGRKADVSGLRREGADVVREHVEASSAAAAYFPSRSPH